MSSGVRVPPLGLTGKYKKAGSFFVIQVARGKTASAKSAEEIEAVAFFKIPFALKVSEKRIGAGS